MPKYEDLALVIGVLDDEEEEGFPILEKPSILQAIILTDELRDELQARISE